MSIEEQIQILEDNLNEYGQCDITIEEYNYLKDEIYADGCLAGIELGKKETIEEFRKYLKEIIPCEMPQDLWNIGVDNTCDRMLKEQKND